MTTLGIQLQGYLQNPNMIAFLSMIRNSEGADYNSLFGDIPTDEEHRRTFSDFSNHPYFNQIPAPNGYTQYTNKAGVTINTSAAGAYQFTHSTWTEIINMLGVPNFSAPNQDLGAVFLINQKGAIPLIIQGHFEDAVCAVRGTWASLPESGNNQPEHDIATVTNWYVSAGGSVS